MKVKICGVTRQEDALLASRLGADYIGFIFYPKSPRYISPEKAGEIIQLLPPEIKTVGIFVNETVERISHVFHEIGLNIVQLHSVNNESDYRGIRERGIPYLRVTRISADGSKIPEDNNCYAHLLDTFDKDEYGGTGKVFDWNSIRGAGKQKRIFLSGGLNPENVAEAIRIVNPFAVDVSSGVEIEPGVKDKVKMQEFIDKARARS